jgi:hypothetical protein
MARGMAAGEPIVSEAQTKAWDEGCDRIGLGKGETAQERGVFVWDPKANGGRGGLVRPWEKEIDETAEAKNAPFMVGRFFEGMTSPIDGHVFTGRTDYHRYCKERGLTTADDYDKPGGAWDKAERRRQAPFSTPEQIRDRQDRIGRRLYEIDKMRQGAYDREVEAAARRRRERGPMAPTEE